MNCALYARLSLTFSPSSTSTHSPDCRAVTITMGRNTPRLLVKAIFFVPKSSFADTGIHIESLDGDVNEAITNLNIELGKLIAVVNGEY